MKNDIYFNTCVKNKVKAYSSANTNINYDNVSKTANSKIFRKKNNEKLYSEIQYII